MRPSKCHKFRTSLKSMKTSTTIKLFCFRGCPRNSAVKSILLHNPYITPYTTPYTTSYITPYFTHYITPSVSPYTTLSSTPYATPYTTAYTTPYATPYTAPSWSGHHLQLNQRLSKCQDFGF